MSPCKSAKATWELGGGRDKKEYGERTCDAALSVRDKVCGGETLNWGVMALKTVMELVESLWSVHTQGGGIVGGLTQIEERVERQKRNQKGKKRAGKGPHLDNQIL